MVTNEPPIKLVFTLCTNYPSWSPHMPPPPSRLPFCVVCLLATSVFPVAESEQNIASGPNEVSIVLHDSGLLAVIMNLLIHRICRPSNVATMCCHNCAQFASVKLRDKRIRWQCRLLAQRSHCGWSQEVKVPYAAGPSLHACERAFEEWWSLLQFMQCEAIACLS